MRVVYPPGTCIHSDHSGPYARSLGGCYYSQLYQDMGSGNIWAVLMQKKTGHYDAISAVIADARAASFFFFYTKLNNLFRKDETKAQPEIEGEKTPPNSRTNCEQTPRKTQHTQHTPILKTPHTTRHPHSLQTYYLPPGSRHCRNDVHTACKQAYCSQ